MIAGVFVSSYSRQDEAWGRGFLYSVGAHGALAVLFVVMSMGRKDATRQALTEVNFVEAPVVASEPEQAVAGVPAGREAGEGTLGAPGQAAQVASHTEMANVVPLSSPQGTASGEVVVNAPIAGPIVSAGEIGVLGARKAALAPLAGQTVGKPGKAPPMTPTGTMAGQGKGSGSPIALSTQEIGVLRKKEAGIGVPLISQQVVGDSVGDKMRQLADNTVGESRRKKAVQESLKANPLDKTNWGKKKGPFSLEGPLKYRRILKMTMPPYPRWAEEQGIEASVSFRLWVDPKGKVKDNFYLEKTSGYSELDYLAKEALLRFQFVALPADQPQEDEWGVATFQFQLKK